MPTTDQTESASGFRCPVIVMGVAGCGKSSVGIRLAETLGLPYQEGDELHPQANIDKMSAGIPLTDDDRWPWLETIGQQLRANADNGIVITCSALKRTYRERLRAAVGGKLAFVFLDGSKQLLAARMAGRTGHFMPTALLDSQLATLERPDAENGVVTVNIDNQRQEITEMAVRGLLALSAP